MKMMCQSYVALTSTKQNELISVQAATTRNILTKTSEFTLDGARLKIVFEKVQVAGYVA